MIAVIFEVMPEEGKRDDYLELAAQIRPLLDDIKGFVSVERFQSLTNPDKMLSLSFFEDEAAILQWRNVVAHREAQSQGRGDLFKDYRLRISHVLRDYGKDDREQAPADSVATGT